ncbi:protein translocase subunit SecD [Desulfovibrio aminophilus]|nr:protein translocase subunit SecD [Desulfovibrio aminophilus]MCM0754340.1 protein translocase subunit SecD [Desulfovibrio aminophilus]
MKNMTWRVALTLVVIVLGAAYILPSIPAVQDSPLAKFLPNRRINLGLDLKGGIHLTLGVDMKKALENSLSIAGDDLRNSAREDGIVVLKPTLLPGNKLETQLLTLEKQDAFEGILKKQFGNIRVENKEVREGRAVYTLAFTPEYVKQLTKMTLDQAVKTIRNRIDEFGVAEPDIRKQQDENRIQVQLPGLQDPERAIKIIGKTAHLEFKMVDDSVDPAQAAKGVVPPGTELSVILHRNQGGGYIEKPIVLRKEAVLTGEAISDAQVHFGNYGEPYVGIAFNPRGARTFERLTGENVKKRMAIVLDGKVYSAPVIQEKISGGRASITGSFTPEEAADLAVVLRAGSLPAPVSVLEQRTVGPSLGQESIDKGVVSTLVGGALIILFMIAYYGLSGLVADVVLMLNIVLTMAGLAAFGATLTLPGIAGIILTIGMAVDANVLIYERIREEIRKGLGAAAAVDLGFSRATLTIVDANLTSVLTAVILYQFGTGPVRGFAVTLILGILTSMFTAIFVSRIFFDWYVKRRPEAATLSI